MDAVLCDVTPRDGLQIEAVLEPVVRAELASRLAAAGLGRVEVASFVRGDVVPQMRGAEEVVSLLEPSSETEYAGLVLNGRGYERLRLTLLDHATLSLAVTDEYNLENSGQTLEQALLLARLILGRDDGLTVGVTLSCAFGCPLAGHVSMASALSVVEQLREHGVDEIVLADTSGTATPSRVAALVAKVAATEALAGFHGHGPSALANSLTALEAGAMVIDASLAGLGGSTVKATGGNTPTEELVYQLERQGMKTGVELEALEETADWLLPRLGR